MCNASVLVVDDDVDVCRILQRMLSDEQYQVKISPSVAEAIDAIEQNLFDIYVVDFNLPDGTGLDVAERIRWKGSAAPVILLSGCDPTTIALSAGKLGITDIMEKPFSRAVVSSALKHVLRAVKVALV